jgi:hypothetical protein
MFETRKRHAVLLVVALAALGLSGCILSPKEEPPGKKPDATWKDLTNKEDVIDNLLQAYKSHDISHYQEILLVNSPPYSDYLWYNQDTDVKPGEEPYVTRDQDISSTTKMFAAADHIAGVVPSNLFLEMLDLKLYPGSWTQVSLFNDTPCDDCWETTREYAIEIIFSETGNGFTGNDLVKFTVVGVTKNGKTHYYLGRADDIRKSS